MDTATPLPELRLEDFLPLVGSRIGVELGEHRAELEVKEAALIGSPSPRKAPSFHVILRSPPTWRATQGMFRLQHPTLGAIEVFTVPVGPDGVGLCYEIVFN
ncbi:MAG TPA: hypothetical protein VFB32_17510 [Rudaea sp.]|nr:hypothetical protein [Rudaea sp.]